MGSPKEETVGGDPKLRDLLHLTEPQRRRQTYAHLLPGAAPRPPPGPTQILLTERSQSPETGHLSELLRLEGHGNSVMGVHRKAWITLDNSTDTVPHSLMLFQERVQ